MRPSLGDRFTRSERYDALVVGITSAAFMLALAFYMIGAFTERSPSTLKQALASSHVSGTRPGSIYPPRLSDSIRFKVERPDILIAQHDHDTISTH